MSNLQVHHSSKTPEHYTPEHVLNLVIECLGQLDLDPCSNSHEVPNVPARRHFTAEDDGLSQPWHGRVFMNSPYGRPVGLWVLKLMSEYRLGNVTEAIALVAARTDTVWFNHFKGCYVCFWKGRLRFMGSSSGAPFPSALIYLGQDEQNFQRVFENRGLLCQLK